MNVLSALWRGGSEGVKGASFASEGKPEDNVPPRCPPAAVPSPPFPSVSPVHSPWPPRPASREKPLRQKKSSSLLRAPRRDSERHGAQVDDTRKAGIQAGRRHLFLNDYFPLLGPGRTPSKKYGRLTPPRALSRCSPACIPIPPPQGSPWTARALARAAAVSKNKGSRGSGVRGVESGIRKFSTPAERSVVSCLVVSCRVVASGADRGGGNAEGGEATGAWGTKRWRGAY